MPPVRIGLLPPCTVHGSPWSPKGLLWPEAINTITKLGNTLPRPGDAKDPYTAWFGDDSSAQKILKYLQPFGRIAYVTDRTKIKAKSDPRSSKCVFVGYANDHSGDTYKFYNPATKQTYFHGTYISGWSGTVGLLPWTS